MFGVLQHTEQGHLNQFGGVSSPLRGKQWFTEILNLEGVAQSTDQGGRYRELISSEERELERWNTRTPLKHCCGVTRGRGIEG